MRVAIYCRVSTVHQVDKDSLPMQRKDLRSYSELILGCNDYEIFEDAGYSGKNTDRPAFKSMMIRIRAGEFTHLLVWKIDRISRNLLDFSQMYEELKYRGVTFVSKNEQFDTSTAMGEAMLKIILVFAELERKMTSERVTATMISRAAQGQWNGGRIPYGYSYDDETKEFSIREDEAEVCRLLKDTYIKSKSLLFTSKTLNEKGYHTRAGAEWSATAVWIIAQSPFYCGQYQYNKYKGADRRIRNPKDQLVTIENHHPAIFSLEEHEQMVALRKENARSIRQVGQYHMPMNTYIFGRLCYCGKCGARMTSTPGRILKKTGYKTSVYTCPRKRLGECDNKSITDTIIGDFVFNYISNMLYAKEHFSEIGDKEDLMKCLLSGAPFTDIVSIDSNGLNLFWSILSGYKTDKSYVLSARKVKRAEIDPQTSALLKEKGKQERALKKLQNIYLYSGMTDLEFMTKKKEIADTLNDITEKLGMTKESLSDEDFMRTASHLIIALALKSPTVDYTKMASEVSSDVLKEYLASMVDKITICDGQIRAVTFRNGMTHNFMRE